METEVAARAVVIIAEHTDRNWYRLLMNPTVNASPSVKSASKFHFIGDFRLALVLTHMTIHAIVDKRRDKPGNATPSPGVRIH